ncbi:hypothetical protein J5Y09_15270 [Roseomonas sp. PWR1]|uniref:Uncharacterized protein n=1 Tax=Roseomonas nitratireducens TaxID=2820810 RepID=A0ABS4AVK4_9PROT|nr:hypothetical protein [Neoroseomonas nitratireducens]MBP0465284.1 hypothetical protein [Neoroseomonas nitratireducens]
MPTVTVILALAAGPGFPDGSPDHRYEIDLALDAAGRPDAEAWAADPVPWRARRILPEAAPEQGDVQYDPDHGWSIRFFGRATEGPDAPETRFDCGVDPLRPGEHVTVTEPGGAAFAYRVVGIA